MTATLDLSPATLNIIVQQGSRALAPMVFKDSTGTPLVLTNYLARAMVRDTPQGTTALLTLSTSVSGLVWANAAQGALTLDIDAVTLAGVATGIYTYDLELVPPDGVGGWVEAQARAYLSGRFQVKAQTTR